jgi:predicted dehydrogenase
MRSLLVIGCGSIGERHLRCFQCTERCTVAVCDTNARLLGTVMERYGVPRFPSLDAALAGGLFEAAVICTPAPFHLPMAVQTLGTGLHTFIEKPLAIDTAQSFVAVVYVYHVMPWVREARVLARRNAGPSAARLRHQRPNPARICTISPVGRSVSG